MSEEIDKAKVVEHKSHGEVYDVLYRRVWLKTKLPLDEGATLVVYLSEDGRIYARPHYEFVDVFKPIA